MIEKKWIWRRQRNQGFGSWEDIRSGERVGPIPLDDRGHAAFIPVGGAALAVVERERTDDPACSDPTCSYRAELAFQRKRLPLTEEQAQWLLTAIWDGEDPRVNASVRNPTEVEIWYQLRALASSTTEEQRGGLLTCPCSCHKTIEQGGALPGNCVHCRVLGSSRG